MARAHIHAGICGFNTMVEATMNRDRCHVTIDSQCKAIQTLAESLTSVDPYREFTYRGQGPEILDKASQYCSHTACPVPSGIIKAVEIEAGLAYLRM